MWTHGTYKFRYYDNTCVLQHGKNAFYWFAFFYFFFNQNVIFIDIDFHLNQFKYMIIYTDKVRISKNENNCSRTKKDIYHILICWYSLYPYFQN